MFDGGFVLCFPVYAIGRYTIDELANDGTLQQRFVMVDPDGHSALCLFTERELAEEFQISEMIAGNVIELSEPFSLATFLLDRDPSITDVAFDPNSRKVVGCSVTAVIDALRQVSGMG